MKLTTTQEQLRQGLAIVSHAIPGKTTMPVLGNVLLTTDGRDRLKLAGTDLDIAMTTRIGAKVVEEGSVTLPAKLFADVVGTLPAGEVTLTLDARTQTVKIEHGRFTVNIKGIEATEFPLIPGIEGVDPILALPPELLVEAIGMTAFAAATATDRPVLCGVYIRTQGQKLTLAAADGFRLARLGIALDEAPARDAEFNVPAKALLEVARIAGVAEEPVKIIVSPEGTQVLFITETTDLYARLISGTYPDVDRIIPTSHCTRSILDVGELALAVKLAAFFATASQNVIKFTAEQGATNSPGKMVISANAAEVGDNTGEIDAMVEGEAGLIALNVAYLGQLLSCVTTERIALETQSPSSAGVFRLVGGTHDYTHVIMPMSVR